MIPLIIIMHNHVPLNLALIVLAGLLNILQSMNYVVAANWKLIRNHDKADAKMLEKKAGCCRILGKVIESLTAILFLVFLGLKLCYRINWDYHYIVIPLGVSYSVRLSSYIDRMYDGSVKFSTSTKSEIALETKSLFIYTEMGMFLGQLLEIGFIVWACLKLDSIVNTSWWTIFLLYMIAYPFQLISKFTSDLFVFHPYRYIQIPHCHNFIPCIHIWCIPVIIDALIDSCLTGFFAWTLDACPDWSNYVLWGKMGSSLVFGLIEIVEQVMVMLLGEHKKRPPSPALCCF
jgi:hypothetical protein